MKRTIFIAILCVLGFVNGRAQTESLYPTIPQSPSEYDYMFKEGIRYKGENGEAFEKTFIIETIQDIGGKTYAVCYAEDRTVIQNGTGCNYKYSSEGDTLYFRQEGDRVYWLPREGEEEVLVMDYGLKAGEEFVSVDGECFQVAEVGYVGEEDREWMIYNKENEVAPKRLRMVSAENGREEVWVEGIGSLDRGFVPYSAVRRMKNVGEMPQQSTVFYKVKGSVCFLQDINESDYKQVAIERPEGRRNEYNINDAGLNYEFVGDTLHVYGIYYFQLDDGYYFFEFMVDKDNNIACYIWNPGFWGYTTSGCCLPIDVRIPGFEAGTYKIWEIGGNQDITLVCGGSLPSSIHSTEAASGDTDTFYDLTGRRIGQPRRGVYIQGGKKVVVR